MITLDPLCVADAPALLRFELENRAFFEAWVPPRPPGFYDETRFSDRLKALIDDPDGASFLIREDHWILGRVNLGFAGACVEIGYRMGQNAQGRGVATRAVTQALDWARPRASRAEAEVRRSNPASRRVLEKAGFAPTGQSRSFTRDSGERITLYRWARDL